MGECLPLHSYPGLAVTESSPRCVLDLTRPGPSEADLDSVSHVGSSNPKHWDA